MTGKVCNVLFLCTGNSARSILGEELINRLGGGRFVGLGVGSLPAKKVHPMAIETLLSNDLPVDGLRSKSWDEFSEDDALIMDFIFTVCDSADENCPVLPAGVRKEHWPLDDPGKAVGSEGEVLAAFRESRDDIRLRVEGLIRRLSDKLGQDHND